MHVHRLIIQSGDKKIYGVDIQLSYDESKHVNFDVESDYAVAVNNNIPGILRIGIASGQGIRGNNILLTIKDSKIRKEDLWVDSFIVNEKYSPVILFHGVLFNTRYENQFRRHAKYFNSKNFISISIYTHLTKLCYSYLPILLARYRDTGEVALHIIS